MELQHAITIALNQAPYVFGACALALAIEATFDLNPNVGGFWLRFLVSLVLFGYAYLATQFGCLWAMGGAVLMGVVVLTTLFRRPDTVSRSFRGRWSWNLWLIAGVGVSWLLLRPCIKGVLLG